jgi:hypothetical protein
MSATSERTFKNELNRVFRSAKRTLRRCVGWSPAKITNDDIGTEASQCAKFARFQQLYREYKNDPNFYVRNFMDLVYSAVEFFNMLPDSSDDICLTPEVVGDIEQRIMTAKDLIYDLPNKPRYYNVLKTEMTFFVDFLYNFYMRKRLVCPSSHISFSTATPRNSFSLPFPNWRRVPAKAAIAPLPPSFNNNEGNINFYSGVAMRRAKKTRRLRR